MKQIISWILVIAFTFMLGVAVALLYLESAISVTQKSEISSSPLNNKINDENLYVSADLPILAYCELANNPQKYDGKIVRLSATLYQNMHGLKFLDSNCYSEEKETALLFNDKRESEIVDKIAQETRTERFLYWGEPTMIVIGKFKRIKPTRKSDSMEDNTDLHFEILEVEKASKR